MVFLFHQTAREYLLHESELYDSWHHFTEIEAHLVLSQVRLQYLHFSVFDRCPRDSESLPPKHREAKSQEEHKAEKEFIHFIGMNPHLEYSALNWIGHFKHCDQDHSQEAISAATRLCAVNSGSYQT